MAYEIISKEGRGIVADEKTASDRERLKTDMAFRTSEIERARRVMADRAEKGADTSHQQLYIDQINAMEPVKEDLPTLNALDNVLDGNKSNEDLGANRLSNGLDEIAKAQTDMKVRNLESAFEKGNIAREEEERFAIEQKQRTDKRFADFIASRPQTGLGAQQSIQSDIALGANLAGIDRRGSEAASDLAMNIANVQSQGQLETAQRAEEEKARQFEMELQTIGRYANDFMAEIERRKSTPDTADDKLIPYLEAARQEKIMSQNLDPVTGQPLPTQMSIPQALEAYRMGIRSPEVMSVLNASGYEVSTGGGGGGGQTGPTSEQNAAYLAFWNNYMNNPAWADNPQGIIQAITSDKTIEQQIGTTLYNQLLQDAMSYAQGYKPEQPIVDAPKPIEPLSSSEINTYAKELEGITNVDIIEQRLDNLYYGGMPAEQVKQIAWTKGAVWSPPNFAASNFGQKTSGFSVPTE